MIAITDFPFPSQFVGLSGKLDIVFAIDGSRKVDIKTYGKMKDFVKGASTLYNVSLSESHIGILNYGGDTKSIALSLPEGTSQFAIEQSLKAIEPVGGLRHMNKAIRFVDSQMFGVTGGGRLDAGKVLVLLTTGKNSEEGKSDLPKAAKKLKDKGVEIVVIALGRNVDPDELNIVASNPNSFMRVSDGNDIPKALVKVEEASAKSTGNFNIVYFLIL